MNNGVMTIDLIDEALEYGDYSKLKDIDYLDSVEKTQLILKDPIEYIKYCPMSPGGLRMHIYDMLEDIMFEDQVEWLIGVLYDMKTENLLKLFSRKVFERNFIEATTMNFNDETAEVVNDFINYVYDLGLSSYRKQRRR
jgi:hypothetical protein